MLGMPIPILTLHQLVCTTQELHYRVNPNHLHYGDSKDTLGVKELGDEIQAGPRGNNEV